MGFAEDFVGRLKALRFDDTFNPYRDTCSCADEPCAPSIRSELLRAIVESAQARGVEDIWVGRDLGYAGGRRTGLAFTDDATLATHCELWDVPPRKPTRGHVTEPTATATWQALVGIYARWKAQGDSNKRIFLWNVFPLHSHNQGNPFSNRRHSAGEGKQGKELLRDLIGALEPQRLIAIGNDAHDAVSELNASVEPHKVRHPSYGGKADFLSQIRRLYS